VTLKSGKIDKIITLIPGRFLLQLLHGHQVVRHGAEGDEESVLQGGSQRPPSLGLQQVPQRKLIFQTSKKKKK
jgi:hypothetical protein